MTLSRWRRIATGIAAGVIVLCAALLGASLRSDNSAVSVAAEVRPEVIIPIEEDPDTDQADDAASDDEASDDTTSIDTTAGDAAGDGAADGAAAEDDASSASPDEPATSTPDDGQDDETAGDDDEPLSEPVRVDGSNDTAADNAADDSSADDSTTDAADDSSAEDSTTDAADDSSAEDSTTDDAAAPDTTADQAPAADAAPPAPLASSDPSLGTGGGVSDAECALDRLVIYAGARVGGVAGSIRSALAQAGFGAGCPAPVTVLASNCPLQFAGVLGAGSGYDPTKSFVASSANVDRETMTAVMGSVGYAGATIDILDFGFINADQPGEQWMAIFIPPSFSGWEDLAGRAGLAPSTQSLCGPTGRVGS